MPYSIMEALFDGRIIPWERRNTASAERRVLEEKIESERRYFVDKMSSDDGQRFQSLESLLADAAFDEEVEIYSHGFTLGALLLLEVTEKKGTIINT